MSDDKRLKAWFQGFPTVRHESEVVEKGGPGSGHWGHAGGQGGPGNPGGSVPRSTAMSIATGRDWEQRQQLAKLPAEAKDAWKALPDTNAGNALKDVIVRPISGTHSEAYSRAADVAESTKQPLRDFGAYDNPLEKDLSADVSSKYIDSIIANIPEHWDTIAFSVFGTGIRREDLAALKSKPVQNLVNHLIRREPLPWWKESASVMSKALSDPRERMWYEQKPTMVDKGGPMSGHYAHIGGTGGPGHPGGSQPGGGHGAIGAGLGHTPEETKATVEAYKAVREDPDGYLNSLSQPAKDAFVAFAMEPDKALDLADIPGVVQGRKQPRITKKGAEAVNELLNKQLIRQTAAIGSGGYPRMRLTKVAQKLFEEKRRRSEKAKRAKERELAAKTLTQDKAGKMTGHELYKHAGGDVHALNETSQLRISMQASGGSKKTVTWDVWQTYGKGKYAGTYTHLLSDMGHWRGKASQRLSEFKRVD